MMPKYDRGAAFRALHQPGNPFILANAWDVGSARILAGLGAQAIGTTSSGFAFTLGRPDMGYTTRDEHLAHAQDLVAATNLPVSGDLENGYGDDPDTVAQTIKLAAEAGMAGCCIEDTALPDVTAYEFDLAVERIKAAVSAARSLPHDFVLVARADGMMNGQYNFDEALKRLRAFEAVGADCLYAPYPPSIVEAELICKTIRAPVNILMAGEMQKHTRNELAKIGAARLSLGSALSRRVHTTLVNAAKPLLQEGKFDQLTAALTSKDFDPIMAKGTAQ